MNRGSSSRSDIAKGNRDPASKITFKLPAIETNAPAEMITPPAEPKKFIAASASGRFDAPSSGSVPMHTT